jgi:hypothetical protein
MLTPEEKRIRDRAYRAANPQKARATDNAWRAANLDKARAQGRAWCAANPEKARAKNARRYAKQSAGGKESVVETYLCERVANAGGMTPKFKDPSRNGAPDRLVILPGHPTYYVELKRPRGGKLATWQKRYHDDLRACGQRVWILKTKEAVDAFMLEILQ